MNNDHHRIPQAEAGPRESGKQYRSIFMDHSAASMLIDPETGHIIEANHAAAEIYGWPPEVLEQMTIQQLRALAPEEVARSLMELKTRSHAHFETRHRCNDGSVKDLEVYSSRVDIEGRTRLLSFIHDITARKRTEAALRDSERRTKGILETAMDGFWIVDMQGKFLEINEAASRITGWSKEELLTMSVTDVEVVESPVEIQDRIRRVMANGSERFESRQRRKDGSIIDVEVSIHWMPADRNLFVFMRDITERESLQAQLIQAQKVQAIGTLAAGIAHDFNNILGIILGYVSMLDVQQADAQQFNEMIGIINHAIDRGATLVRQILTFARKTDVAIEPLNVRAFVHDMIGLLATTFPKTISFVETYAPNLPEILGDRTQLHQALLNLCVNARDAMPIGGTITITVSTVTQKEMQARFPTALEQAYVCLNVRDTGEGMDETTRIQVFDPFFTTKEKGKGTGLGLSVVYGVVQSHHGYIDVESRPGDGAEFSLYLPAAHRVGQPSQAAVATAEVDFPGGTETVLVVEDEPALSAMVCGVLTSKGYRVLTASDGLEAVKLFAERHSEIDIVLSDIGLPHLNGYQEFKKMQDIDPHVKVIFASGYFEPTMKDSIETDGARGFIQKPYRPGDILLTIRSLLDEAGSRSAQP